MAEKLWKFTDAGHRALFGQLLAPLVAAAGTFVIREWRDEAYSRVQLQSWILSLCDVPEPILRESLDRVIARGVTLMPRPGDVKAVCCEIVDERRREAAKRAAALKDECAQCGGSQWVSSVSDGVETVKRCWCFTRGLELIAEAGEPLKRPALQAAEPQEVA